MDEYQGMNEYQSEDAKSRKVKTIAVATVAAVVVLLAAVWGISSIVGSVNSKNTSGEATNVVSKEEDKKVAGDQGELSPADQYVAETKKDEAAEETPVFEPVAVVEEVPATGPADMALTALLMGVATTLALTNLEFAKRNA